MVDRSKGGQIAAGCSRNVHVFNYNAMMSTTAQSEGTGGITKNGACSLDARPVAIQSTENSKCLVLVSFRVVEARPMNGRQAGGKS